MGASEMDTANCPEPRTMPKAQKTIMVPEDLYRLVADREAKTGTTFTRQAIAALLQYFFSDPRGPDPDWMEAVIGVEQGTISVADVPSWVAEKKKTEAYQTMLRMRKEFRQEGDDPAGPLGFRDVSYYREMANRACLLAAEWRLLNEPDTISALLNFWRSVKDTHDRLDARSRADTTTSD